MLSTPEKSQIKALLQSPQWRTIELFKKQYIERLRQNSPLRDTEWNTLQALLVQEGKIQGVDEFVAELYKIAE